MGFGDFVKSLFRFQPIGMLFNGIKSVFGKSGVTSGLSDLIDEHGNSYLNSITGAHLTGSQVEANEMQMQNAEDIYQREVMGMQKAGLNPALMYQNGASPSVPSVPANNASASLSDLMQIAMLPAQIKMLNQQVKGAELENQAKAIDLKFLEQEKITSLNYTSTQIDDLKDMIKTREVERRLKESGISLNEADTALSIQRAIAEHIDNQTRDMLNQSMLAYRAAETAYSEQKTEESKKNMEVMAANVSELYARAIMEGAQAGVYTQTEKNLLVEHGILEWNEKEHAFTVDHQKADRTWRIIDNVVGDVTKVVGAAGTFVGGLGLGALRGAKSAKSEGSGLYVPTGMNAFGEHYRFNR